MVATAGIFPAPIRSTVNAPRRDADVERETLSAESAARYLMLVLTLAATAATIGGTVVGDHVLEIERPTHHLVFLYLAMFAVLVAFALGDMRGLLA
jgi:hypothetical protein